ncbi:nucleotidyl transferase AbiEii/AbiGii toxin family protein [Frankia sp. CNm7]|uniref:Nucleotidyl transferase AbiEii/AbiGii toxin family protein n=1 Tax=Frankia nepalensis TaxID=1836974 RepID=A0A937R928_9ACTN|nr:nucleotidyl transferase AbiEii/AbiGii toxin family protein [Frankia nepalensis]MBL7498145.1 nucleotidyl transferase AbiEii/AbiGii toxin family protein [Frankia nepalensis]MBL7509337.1 nucleotidyl transferase AbiEii/AbiGii toxin family protein [Frankia nepalensis]MBL7516875.1 nucleotidyl transferase AbiEii/AbiGii toxin family protein [Frankia nepalensis]MBL7627933.1 nucleotidyl transferase AbiEii/AbiGii toxin family protein [Frankia nepalensis]
MVVTGGPIARRAAVVHALRVLSASGWAEYLVLRGSVVLKAWLGELAREPADIDFVVTGGLGADGLPTWEVDEGALVAGVVAALTDDPVPGLRADQIEVDDINGYYGYYGYYGYPSGVPPRRSGTRISAPLPHGFQEERPEQQSGARRQPPVTRLLFPYGVGDERDVLQVDLAFGERMLEAPVVVEIPPLGTRMLAATPVLSLAWKVHWLLNDVPARGKDLYDAVLLAEHMPVPLARLCDLLVRLDDLEVVRMLRPNQVDWDRFRAQHPHIEGDARSWLNRLGAALADN